MQNEDFNVNNIVIPKGKNEFESIIDIQEPINVAKDDENRKETPEEQQQRLREEVELQIPKKDSDEAIKKRFKKDILKKATGNNDDRKLNDEEFELYKKYRKIVKPDGYNTTKVPTFGAVKKFYEREKQKKT